MGVEFVSPTEDPDPAAMRISVHIAPAAADLSEPELLEDLAIEFMNQRSRTGRDIVPIAAIKVDGRDAAQDSLEWAVSSPSNPVRTSAWVAGFPAYQKIWYITVSGPKESIEEIEAIYGEFLSHFHLLPRP